MRALSAALGCTALLLAAGAVRADFDQAAAFAASQAVIGHAVGDYRLRDTSGRTLALAALRGKPLVVSFVYTGCFQVCPASTRALERAVREARRELGQGAFRVATIGFNLPFDTPEAMQEFARKQGVNDPNWVFLSPEPESLPGLVAAFGFRYEATPAGFDHLLQASIVDARGRVVRQLYGDAIDGATLAAALRARPQAAPDPGVAAGLIERLRIVCSVYDPATGAYVFNPAYLVELIIGASIILLGFALVVYEWRRQRPRRARTQG